MLYLEGWKHLYKVTELVQEGQMEEAKPVLRAAEICFEQADSLWPKEDLQRRWKKSKENEHGRG